MGHVCNVQSRSDASQLLAHPKGAQQWQCVTHVMAAAIEMVALHSKNEREREREKST
jgi:hypothetical protein